MYKDFSVSQRTFIFHVKTGNSTGNLVYVQTANAGFPPWAVFVLGAHPQQLLPPGL